MNKNPLILYISLLPVVVLVVLILGAGYLLLKDDLNFFGSNNEPQVRRLEGFPVTIPIGTEIEKQRTVIRSQEELEDFLSAVDPEGTLEFNENVNFDREFLVGASTSTEKESNKILRVRRLYENTKDNSLKVSLRQIDRKGECPQIDYSYVSIDLVAISKTDHSIDFELVREETDKCD
jgi:hypothetical protein